MNFCPKCRFMLYTKREQDKSDEQSDEKSAIDANKYILKNYCRNCSWEGPYNNQGERITVYKKNYTNEFLTEKSLISQYTINDPTLPRISNIRCVNDNCLTNLGKSLYLIVVDDDKRKEIDKLNYKKIIELDSSHIVIDLQEGEDVTGLKEDLDLDIAQYQKPDTEIIFMKYDPINLKYIYICSTCNTTWKND